MSLDEIAEELIAVLKEQAAFANERWAKEKIMDALEAAQPRGQSDEAISPDEKYCFDCRQWYTGEHDCPNPHRR